MRQRPAAVAVSFARAVPCRTLHSMRAVLSLPAARRERDATCLSPAVILRRRRMRLLRRKLHCPGVSAASDIHEARLFFDRRVGTEFSPQGAEIARTTGADVFVGGVEQIPPEAKFDCVVATQVIEHVYQPLPFVTQIAERTTPGGHIVLATPNIGGVLSKFMGRRWPSFKAPEHVVYFDFQTLSALMRRAGLDDVRRFPYPHAFPLGLLAAKFGLALPPLLAPFKIWMPATTFAVYGRVPSA